MVAMGDGWVDEDMHCRQARRGNESLANWEEMGGRGVYICHQYQ